MILIALFQRFCGFILFATKVLFTAGIAIAGTMLVLALICELTDDE